MGKAVLGDIRGAVVGGRFQIVVEMPGGAHSQVYRAFDRSNPGTPVVLKVEIERPGSRKLLYTEAEVLRLLWGASGIPQVIAFFQWDKVARGSVLVLELLGEDLRLVLHRSRKLSTRTVAHLGYQMLRSLEAVHDGGLIHRDVKPGNFVLGRRADEAAKVYIIDFGLVRRHLDENDVPRPSRHRVAFRGTTHYASVSALHYNDLGRVDDLWSLAFSLLELATGELPWENMYSRGLGKAEKQAAKIKVLKIKERFVAASLHGDPASCSILKESADYLRRVPAPFLAFMRCLDGVTYKCRPDYALLRKTLRRAGTVEECRIAAEREIGAGAFRVSVQRRHALQMGMPSMLVQDGLFPHTLLGTASRSKSSASVEKLLQRALVGQDLQRTQHSSGDVDSQLDEDERAYFQQSLRMSVSEDESDAEKKEPRGRLGPVEELARRMAVATQANVKRGDTAPLTLLPAALSTLDVEPICVEDVPDYQQQLEAALRATMRSSKQQQKQRQQHEQCQLGEAVTGSDDRGLVETSAGTNGKCDEKPEDAQVNALDDEYMLGEEAESNALEPGVEDEVDMERTCDEMEFGDGTVLDDEERHWYRMCQLDEEVDQEEGEEDEADPETVEDAECVQSVGLRKDDEAQEEIEMVDETEAQPRDFATSNSAPTQVEEQEHPATQRRDVGKHSSTSPRELEVAAVPPSVEEQVNDQNLEHYQERICETLEEHGGAQPSNSPQEDCARISSEEEATLRAEEEMRLRVEEEARQTRSAEEARIQAEVAEKMRTDEDVSCVKMDEEAVRQRESVERARMLAEEDASLAQKMAQQREVDECGRMRAEEDDQRKFVEAQERAQRLAVKQEAWRRAEEEAKQKRIALKEKARRAAVEQDRRHVEAWVRRKKTEERERARRLVEEAMRRAEEDVKRKKFLSKREAKALEAAKRRKAALTGAFGLTRETMRRSMNSAFPVSARRVVHDVAARRDAHAQRMMVGNLKEGKLDRTRERDENIADEQKHGERGFHETSDDDAQLSGLVPIAFKEDGGQYLAAQPQLSNLLSVASEAGAQRPEAPTCADRSVATNRDDVSQQACPEQGGDSLKVDAWVKSGPSGSEETHLKGSCGASASSRIKGGVRALVSHDSDDIDVDDNLPVMLLVPPVAASAEATQELPTRPAERSVSRTTPYWHEDPSASLIFKNYLDADHAVTPFKGHNMVANHEDTETSDTEELQFEPDSELKRRRLDSSPPASAGRASCVQTRAQKQRAEATVPARPVSISSGSRSRSSSGGAGRRGRTHRQSRQHRGEGWSNGSVSTSPRGAGARGRGKSKSCGRGGRRSRSQRGSHGQGAQARSSRLSPREALPLDGGIISSGSSTCSCSPTHRGGAVTSCAASRPRSAANRRSQRTLDLIMRVGTHREFVAFEVDMPKILEPSGSDTD